MTNRIVWYTDKMKMKVRKVVAFIMAIILVFSYNPIGLQAKKTYKIKKLILNAKKKKMYVKETYKLKVKRVKPIRAIKKVKWKTSNKTIATVSKNGIVTAKKVGNTWITATSKSRKTVKARCKIIVIKKPNYQNTVGNSSTNPTIKPNVSLVPPIVSPTPKVNIEPTKKPEVKPSEQPAETFKVTFVDYDGSVIAIKNVKKNQSVIPPMEPIRKGYKFIGWDKKFDNITSDLIVTAQYEENSSPAIYVQKITTLPGARAVKVPVCVRNNPGILGMTFAISFDERALTLVDVENGDAVCDVLTMTSSKELGNGCKFVWDGEEVTDADVKDGAILVLVFDVSEIAQNGEYQISIICNNGDVVNNELTPIPMLFENGYVKLNSLREG